MNRNQPKPAEVSVERWLSKAKTKMNLAAPFHGSVVAQSEFIEREDIPTAATDGTHIYYNAGFVSSLTLPKLCWLLAHEAEHIMMMHCFRMGKRYPKKWNFATDYSINSTSLEELVRAGVFERIEDTLYDEKYVNLSSEKIYDLMDDSEVPEDTDCHVLSPGDTGEGDGEGGDGEGQGKSLSEDQLKELEEQAKRKVLAAAETAKAQGKLPGEYSHLLEKLRQPKINWEDLLHRAVVGEIPEDYTYRKPNRKFINSGFYMPSILKRSVGNIYVWRDTSASMTQRELELVTGGLVSMILSVRPTKVVVIDCDYDVQSVREFTPDSDLSVLLKSDGGGGTSPDPFFDWVEENGEDVQAILCLTDMGFYVDKDKLPSSCDVTWISTMDSDPGVGNFIYVGD